MAPLPLPYDGHIKEHLQGGKLVLSGGPPVDACPLHHDKNTEKSG